MNLRAALIQQSPSLALQRAASDEIAWLDAKIARVLYLLYNPVLQSDLVEQLKTILED